jgi:glycosyltransferase involved in cell wall biosynthesis
MFKPPGRHPDFVRKNNGARILLVSHELTRTGAPIILWRIAKDLSEKGYQITVVSPFDGPLRDAYLKAGMQVLVIPSLLEDARLLLSNISGHDLVFANTIVAFRAVHAARAYGRPCLWWVHESAFGQRWALSSQTVAQAFETAETVMFPSQATADFYLDFSQQDNYHPIHYGLDFPDRETETPFERKKGKFYIIQVGSIEHRKGQDVLLRALAGLPYNVANKVECYLIGRILSKSEKQFCQQIAKTAQQMGNVHLLGEIPSGQVHRFMEAVDVVVLASRDEALPITVLEAMGIGKAIIATRVAGVPEVIEHGVNGLLVENEDAAAITQNLLKLYHDRLMVTELGANAKRTFEARLTFGTFRDRVSRLVHDLVPNDRATHR